MKKNGFTLAEVLITLGIIGVVAAVTIPTLVSNYKYKQIGTRLSKFVSNTENAARAWVASNHDIITQEDLRQFYSDSFIVKNSYDPQGVLIGHDYISYPINALVVNNATPVQQGNPHSELQDGTSIALAYISGGTASGLPAEKYGDWRGIIYFDTAVKGLPQTAQHVFVFEITSKGFVVPANISSCTTEIAKNNWIIDNSWYKAGGICNKSDSSLW